MGLATTASARTRDGAAIRLQSFGDRADPAILLIQGAGAAMDWWDADLCQALAGGGRFVVRYDHRDTGDSETYPPGAPGYTGHDLATDVLAVLDAAGVERAHLVGLSMGGALAQVVALTHPERVESLTLVATTPVGPLPDGLELDLPPMSDELAAVFASPDASPDWADPAAAVEALVDAHRPYAGSLPFDEAGLRATAESVVARSRDLASAGNHHLAPPGPEPTGSLVDLSVPTLVLHGTEDPLFPLPHGEALARLIPGAVLVPLAGAGHEVPRSTWAQVVPAILAHTAGS